MIVGACASPPAGHVRLQDLTVGPVHYLDDSSALIQLAGPPTRRRGPSVVSGGPLDVWYYPGFQCWMVKGWRCDQLSTTDTGILVARHVRVGMTSREVIAILGPPARKWTSGDTVYFAYDPNRSSAPGVGLVAKFTDDTARAFVVGQVLMFFM